MLLCSDMGDIPEAKVDWNRLINDGKREAPIMGMAMVGVSVWVGVNFSGPGKFGCW